MNNASIGSSDRPADNDVAFDEGSRAQAFVYAVQECLRSALSSIRSHGMRSFLTMLGVIIGVASVICVVSLLQGLTQSVLSEFQGLGGNSLQVAAYTSLEDYMIGRVNHLRQNDLDQIRNRIDGISNVTPLILPTFGAGVRAGSNTTAAQILATKPWYQLANQAYPRYGRFITESDNDTVRRAIETG